MKTKDVIASEINSEGLRTRGLIPGTITALDLVKQKVEVTVVQGDQIKKYGGLPLPSYGRGIRFNSNYLNSPVFIGFVGGNIAVPFIQSINSGTGLGIEPRPDLSTSFNKGKLHFLQGIK